MPKIKKLDPKVIDQIAAGEVVERPASVLKELLDNAVDSGATKISIKIKKGGLERIEVQDNGCGIEKDDVSLALQSHTTSKIESISDISEIKTMGFRGEALSSISSVSKVTIRSSTGEQSNPASEIVCTYGETGDASTVSMEAGTTVIVENLFENLPARKKFLKSEKTEYRKLLEVFIPIALINSAIHFTFNSNGRDIYNLPAVKNAKNGSLHPRRVSEILKDIEFVDLFYDGEGITIGGGVGHPRHHATRTSVQYTFINGRPVWDSGVAKAVSVGASRFIPEDSRVPFVVAVSIPTHQVDVNVHPRKLEVRFANPYRVYSAVENAVKAAYEQNLGADSEEEEYSRFRKSGVVSPSEKSTDDRALRLRPRAYEVKKSLEFSKMLLEDSDDTVYSAEGEPKLTASAVSQVRQFLGRYILASVGEELWIIDQHAAAERIRFEKLIDEFDKSGVPYQNLLAPMELQLSDSDLEFIKEVKDILESLGYFIDISKSTANLSAVPESLKEADHQKLIQELLGELRDIEDFKEKGKVLAGKYRDSVIATMACHSSVRMNRKLDDAEARSIIEQLLKCNNSYSCPHGRPIIWKLAQKDIDDHFERG